MKAYLAFAFAFSICFVAQSQKSPIKFGSIPGEDLRMTVYPQDSSASAVVLADYGEVYLSLDGAVNQLMFERHVRIKILTKEGRISQMRKFYFITPVRQKNACLT